MRPDLKDMQSAEIYRRLDERLKKKKEKEIKESQDTQSKENED